MCEAKVGRDSLEVTGHANFDDRGRDIVCSAISSLILGAAELWGGNDMVRVIMGDEPPMVRFNFLGFTDHLRGQFDLVVGQLKILSRNYPGHLRVITTY